MSTRKEREASDREDAAANEREFQAAEGERNSGNADGIASTGERDEFADERDGGNVRASLDRVLAHAEAQGEVYVGAVDDIKRIREAMTGDDASDRNPVGGA